MIIPNNFARWQWAGASIFGGATDTVRIIHLFLNIKQIYRAYMQTVSATLTFFLAMVHNPQVQATAQAEIDRVVGHNRLPKLSDRESLPYVEALYKEVLRWYPVAPLAVPHRLDSDTDDEYRGE